MIILPSSCPAMVMIITEADVGVDASAHGWKD